MMNEQDVVDVLKMADRISVGVWIDGGWGVDALVGRQTRPHNDIDIFVERKDAEAFTKMLTIYGFRESQTDFTTADHTEWREESGLVVDLHIFEFVDVETVSFDSETYPAGILRGKGTIGGIAVRCLTAEAQMLYHQGYEYDENDVHDVLLLHEHFGLPVPTEYANCIEKQGFSIRYVTESDKTFWFSLDKHMSENEYDIKVRDRRGYIIEDNTSPIGIMRYNLFWDNTPFLTLIYIKESSQGKGYGKRAMSHWENEMLERGFTMVMTSTQADEQAQHFYRKLGYVDRGCLILDNTPFEQPQEILMIKKLEGGLEDG